MMNRVLAPYLGKFCVVYLDDVLIYSNTADEHLEHIRVTRAAATPIAYQTLQLLLRTIERQLPWTCGGSWTDPNGPR
jgi:hypothetical protein